MLPEALLVTLTVEHGAGADDCMPAAKLQRSVEKRLRRHVFAEPSQAALRLAVAYTRRGSEVEARITLASADGTPRGSRALVTEGHCSRLDDSLALSLALLVDQPPDPEPQEEKPSAVPPPTPDLASATPPPRRAPTPISIPREVGAPRQPWHVRVGAAVMTAFEVLPQLRPAGALSITLLPADFPAVTLQGEAFASATGARDATSGARFRLLRAGLTLCPSVGDSVAFSAGLCFGQKVSWIDVEGFGFDRVANESAFGLALTAGGEGRLQLATVLWVRGYLGVEAPLVRDRFYAGGPAPTDLFRASPAALSAEIGVEVELW